jgi:hypothetical protein
MERKAAAAMATEAEFGGSVSKDFGQARADCLQFYAASLV